MTYNKSYGKKNNKIIIDKYYHSMAFNFKYVSNSVNFISQ